MEEREQVEPRIEGICNPDSPEESTVTQMTRKKIKITWIYRSGRKSATRKRNRKRRK